MSATADLQAFRFEPPEREPAEGTAPEDALPQLACVNYGWWSLALAERARLLLAEHPDLTRRSLYAAAAAGDVSAATEHLERDPALVNRKGGPFGWEPLLYACYSRIDPVEGYSTLEVARLLLSRGADPDAGFLWAGNVPPFTALTGAFGEGEDGRNQPPHREWRALARLLLEADADANDGQTLYNRHFNRGDEHLEMLFEYGLGRERRGPWFERLGDRLTPPGAMLVEELWAAARKGFTERVELLVAHGADVNGRGFRDGRTPYESAMLSGNVEIAELLLARGAANVDLKAPDAFAAACVAGDAAKARALMAADPKLVQRLGQKVRTALVHRAVEARRPEGIRLMAALGFEIDGLTRNTPMHDAAWAGDLEIVKLLLELGADPNVKEPTYGGTPRDWAAHNGQTVVADFLDQQMRGSSSP